MKRLVVLPDLTKGDTHTFEVTVSTDITDWEIRARLYDDNCSAGILVKNTAAGGSDDEIEILDATEGIFLIKIAKDLTTNFADKGFLEIEIHTADGVRNTILNGSDTSIKFLNETIR